MDYDEDDLYDYEEAYEEEPQGISADDQKHMLTGTIAVREGLGDTSDFITDKEIQDALWHYFYDANKSIAYLKKQKRPAEQQEKPKKQKSPSKFDQAAQQAQASVNGASVEHSAPLWAYASHVPSNFFVDTPFLAVPRHRLGNLHPGSVSQIPKGGLLGGSSDATPSTGKPSKLAALAASRKKTAEEKRKARAGETEKPDAVGNTSVRAEHCLGKRQKTGSQDIPENVEITRSAVEGLSLKEANPSTERIDAGNHATAVQSAGRAPGLAKRSYPRKEQRPAETTSTLTPPATQSVVEEPPEPGTSPQPEDDLQAAPSSFASSLFSAPSTKVGRKTVPKSTSLSPTFDYIQSSNHDPFSGPSPDDIVKNAQQGKGSKSAKPGPKKKTPTNDATNGIKSLKLDNSAPTSGTSTPAQSKVKSKNIDVAAEAAKGNHRRSANFVVIGHVDHGKSTLMGRLLHDSSYISSRDFSKLSASAAQAGKSSFSYAWLMDSTAEERARGITVDIAQTSFSTPATETTPATDFNILDAPGHKDFVPNMIAGASQADFAVLVVDASTGEFEKGLEGGGQTKEHALLVRGLGVQSVVVAVNKMDQTEWSEARFQEVEGQIVAFLGKIGYRKDDIRVVPCAGLTGENVVFRKPPVTAANTNQSKAKTGPATTTKDRFTWYAGPTLLASLSAFTPQEHNLHNPLRITISDVFRGSVTNPLSISGRLDAGTVQVGDTLLAMPAGETCIVRGIEATSSITKNGAATGSNSKAGSDDATTTDYAVAGQIATLHLTEIDAIHLRLGDVLCSPSAPIKNAVGFTAKVLAFEHVMPGTLDCHRGRMHCSASVTKLVSLVGTRDAAVKKRPRVVKPGQGAIIAVSLEKALPLEVGTRIVLRSEGSTVAAGVVEEVVS